MNYDGLPVHKRVKNVRTGSSIQGSLEKDLLAVIDGAEAALVRIWALSKCRCRKESDVGEALTCYHKIAAHAHGELERALGLAFAESERRKYAMCNCGVCRQNQSPKLVCWTHRICHRPHGSRGRMDNRWRRCPVCREPMFAISGKARIPPKRNVAAWRSLQQWYGQLKVDAWQAGG